MRKQLSGSSGFSSKRNPPSANTHMKVPMQWIGRFAGRALIGSGLLVSSLALAQESPPQAAPPPVEEGRVAPHAMRDRPGKQGLRHPGERPGFMKRPEAGGKVRRPGSEMPRMLPPRARIHHLQRAAEALAAAGYPDHADKARKEISRLEEQARKEEGSRRNEANRAKDWSGEVARMRKEMEELRQQVRRLKAEMAKKPEPPAVSQ